MKPYASVGTRPSCNTLTPPLSDVTSFEDPECNEVEAAHTLSPKASRLSLSSLMSRSELISLRKVVPKRPSSAQSISNSSFAPQVNLKFDEPSESEMPDVPIISPPIDATAQLSDSPPAVKPKFKFMRKSSNQKVPDREIAALEGEEIAPRLKLGIASIDGEFHRIEYGQYKGRPACLITVDLRLIYQPDHTIKSVKIDFQFSPVSGEGDDQIASAKCSPISKILFPIELEGMADRSKDTQQTKWDPEFAAFSIKAKVGGGGGHKTVNTKHRWRVQGQTEEHDEVYDTFRWRIMENTVSEDSVPRNVRLGMIAFHNHSRFWVETTINGGIRGNMRGKALMGSGSIKEKRWFEPPPVDQVGEHLLHEDMLRHHVESRNLQIVDVEPDRKLERQLGTLIDFTAINANGNGDEQDGGGMMTGSAEQDLMSTFGNDAENGADACD